MFEALGTSGGNSKFANRFLEGESAVKGSTYHRFFFSSGVNYFLVPFALVFFLLFEVLLAVLYHVLAMYDDVAAGRSVYFGGDWGLYQSVLALLVLSMVVTLVVKYFLLNLTILLASERVHCNMIEAILHSPTGFFDRTPSGILINKFSNDLSLIDYSLIFALIDTVEGPTAILMAVANTVLINHYFAVPYLFFLIFSVWFFRYARPVIIKGK